MMTSMGYKAWNLIRRLRKVSFCLWIHESNSNLTFNNCTNCSWYTKKLPNRKLKKRRRGLSNDRTSMFKTIYQKKNLGDGFWQSELSSNNAVILNPHYKTNKWHSTYLVVIRFIRKTLGLLASQMQLFLYFLMTCIS